MSPDRTVNTDKSQGSKDDKIRRADPHPNIIHPATKAEESRRQKKGFGSDSSAGAGTLQSPARWVYINNVKLIRWVYSNNVKFIRWVYSNNVKLIGWIYST